MVLESAAAGQQRLVDADAVNILVNAADTNFGSSGLLKYYFSVFLNISMTGVLLSMAAMLEDNTILASSSSVVLSLDGNTQPSAKLQSDVF